MILPELHSVVVIIQNTISFLGTLIILAGILQALYFYIFHYFTGNAHKKTKTQHELNYVNNIRLQLGRTLILGLEFIVAADLIGTTTTPDYYSLGILAGIVLIRTLLSFSLNKELIALNKES